MSRFKNILALSAALAPLVFLLSPNRAETAVPQLINFQGQLKDGSGNPVADGLYSVQFTIYDAPSGGNVFWAETTSVSTGSGLFTTLLGADNPLPDSVFNDSSRYLGIKVGADPEMIPRQKLSSVGYSYNSSEWTSAAGNLFRLNGNVGIGTASPTAKLHVENSTGTGVYSYSSSGIGVWGEGITWGLYGTSTSNTGVVGSSSSGYGVSGSGDYGVYGGGVSYGIYGTSSSGTGVYGSGNTYGVYGSSSGGNNPKYGVFGYASAGNGYGAQGARGEAYTTGGGNALGGYFYGSASGALSIGVYGDVGSSGTYGVYGTGGNYGVYGEAYSNGGAGVYASSSSGPGVVALGGTNGVEATGVTRGVYAIGGSYGVVGGASANGGAGVYGSNSGNPATWGGYFVGDTYVTGNFTCAGFKSATVKVDNGEYRLLYAQESPENWFEDFGSVQLVNGRVVVTIEPTFAQTVNTAVTYHVFLTPKGDCRGLYVTNETPTSFEIRELQNGKSDIPVSYRIVAKRKGYENVRLAKMTGQTPEEAQAKDAELRAEMAKENARHQEEQAKMEAERKQHEEQRAKMEQERLLQEQKIKENK